MKSQWFEDMDLIVSQNQKTKTICAYCGNEFKTKLLKKEDFEFFATRSSFCSETCRKFYKDEISE